MDVISSVVITNAISFKTEHERHGSTIAGGPLPPPGPPDQPGGKNTSPVGCVATISVDFVERHRRSVHGNPPTNDDPPMPDNPDGFLDKLKAELAIVSDAIVSAVRIQLSLTGQLVDENGQGGDVNRR